MQLLIRLGPVAAHLVNRLLDLNRRLRSCGRTLGVRRPWWQLRLRQTLEKARLVGESGAPAADHVASRHDAIHETRIRTNGESIGDE